MAAEVTCPYCEATVPQSHQHHPTKTAQCPECQSVFFYDREPKKEAPEPASSPREPSRDLTPEMPPGVSVEDLGSELCVERRWFKRQTVPMLLFALIWNGFLVFWFQIARDEEVALITYLVPIIHMAVGASLLYRAMAELFNRTKIRVTRNEIQILHRPIPWKGSRVLYPAGITQLFCRRSSGSKRRGRVDLVAKTTMDELVLLDGVRDRRWALFVESAIEDFLRLEDRDQPGDIRR